MHDSRKGAGTGDKVSKSTLTVLLIEDSAPYANLVQHWLSTATGGIGFRLDWTDSLAAGMRRLEQSAVDVVLLDLGLPDCIGIESFTQTRIRAPKTPILILSSADSESLALQMIQEGAEDYLVKSGCDAETLIRTVRHAVARRTSLRNVSQAATRPNRILGVLGTKGGVGTTTIACTLASELSRQTDQKAVLLDLDSGGGNASFVTGIECKYSIRDAVHNINRLDINFWESIVAVGPDELHVVSSAGLASSALDPGNVRDVLAFVQSLYPWTVLDLGRLNQASLDSIEYVNEVFVVTTATIPALFNAKRAIETLQTAAIDADRIRLIVNRVGKMQPLSQRALHNMFGVPVYAAIPSDGGELHKACVEKRLASKDSPFRKAIAHIVQNLTGIAEQPRKGTLASLVSLAERFRRTAAGIAASSIR
jgi:pilus assembly protein CpaE